MTRKDYQLIADVFARSAGDDIAKFLAVNLADKLEQDNPRFDRARFLTACGVK
jgi:hypothetical protein